MSQYLGKKYSFIQLLENNNFTISIPLIQRDYVQGKQNKVEVRNEFLKTLKRYLIDGENKDLDFVYGFVKDNKFIPLDGQQRLTTLFLLHTYVAIKSNMLDFWSKILTNENGFKFLYEVRRSSTQFCENLIINGIDFNDFEKSRKDYPTLNSYVHNLSWYKKTWNQDPTIASMINMFAAIHEEFNNEECDYFERLFSKEQPTLTFLFLDLENLNQGDELYIKMNARGKMLSNFENFKARFEEKISQLYNDHDVIRMLSYKDKHIEMSTKDYFSFKLDSVWSNLFWIYRDLVGESDNYDDEIFNFIKEVLIIHYIKNIKDNNHSLEVILNTNIQTFNSLNNLGLISKESVNYLISVLDVIPYNDKGLITYCNNIHFDEEAIFKSALSHKIQSKERVKFYSYIEYLLCSDFEISKLNSWMRVISNLVENKIFNTQDMIIPAFESVSNLLNKADNILEYLNSKPKISFFDANQIKEEIIKSKLITSNNDYFAGVYKAEQNIFHAGQIAYLLEYSGILNHFDLDMLELINHNGLNDSYSKFMAYSDKSRLLFSFLDHNQNYIFERSLLTYGKYMIRKNDFQYNFSSSKSVANYDRDYSWKRMLAIDFENLDDQVWKEKRDIVLQVFEDATFDFLNVKESLLLRINNYNEARDWQYDFIKNPEFLRACRQGFINTYDNFNNIQLLNASQMNHLWMNYHVFKFWLQLIDVGIENSLDSVKGNYDVPTIGLYDLIISRKSYAIQFYKMEDGEFYIRCYKFKGFNKIEDYGSEIVQLSLDNNLRWNQDPFHLGFTFHNKDYKKATEVYIQLHNLIKTLQS